MLYVSSTHVPGIAYREVMIVTEVIEVASSH